MTKRKRNTSKKVKLMTDENAVVPACVICLEKMQPSESDNICVLRCGHRFHDVCLQTWIWTYAAKNETPGCPVCRVQNTSCQHDEHRHEVMLQIIEKQKDQIVQLTKDKATQDDTITALHVRMNEMQSMYEDATIIGIGGLLGLHSSGLYRRRHADPSEEPVPVDDSNVQN